MISFAVFASLFWSALLAATIFPAQSELVLLGLLLTDQYSWAVLILIATAGNTIGSAINWLIGMNIAQLEKFRWFPIQRSSMVKAEMRYQRYGKWSLLLSWAPFIGDPLTLAAGFLREKFTTFLLIVAIAKFARYIVIAALASGFL